MGGGWGGGEERAENIVGPPGPITTGDRKQADPGVKRCTLPAPLASAGGGGVGGTVLHLGP
jgi:hypothetical protein